MLKLLAMDFDKLLKIAVIQTFFYTPSDFEVIFDTETTIMFVSTCVIEIADFSTFEDRSIGVTLTHLV